MKQAVIYYRTGEYTTIQGKNAGTVMANWLEKIGILDKCIMIEIGQTFLFLEDGVDVKWIYDGNRRG